MAKKVRRKPEEEEAAAFEFPVFDEAAFVAKEGEMSAALGLFGIATAVLGLGSWALTHGGVPFWGPLLLGLLGLAVTPLAVARLRSRSDLYTRTDWVGLGALEFFGWLAIWFVLVNLA